VEIEAETANVCREEMLDMFGTKWSMQYDDLKDINNPGSIGTVYKKLPLVRNRYGYYKLQSPVRAVDPFFIFYQTVILIMSEEGLTASLKMEGIQEEINDIKLILEKK